MVAMQVGIANNLTADDQGPTWRPDALTQENTASAPDIATWMSTYGRSSGSNGPTWRSGPDRHRELREAPFRKSCLNQSGRRDLKPSPPAPTARTRHPEQRSSDGFHQGNRAAPNLTCRDAGLCDWKTG